MHKNISLPTLSGLMVNQAVKIATMYMNNRDWNKTKTEAVANNIMQIDKSASSRRYASYVISLLKKLSDEEIGLLVTGTVEDQKALMWLSFCRSYPLVAGFVSEVVREKFLSHDFSLSISDWNEFLLRKAQEDDGMDNIGKATRTKAKTVVFSNLRQADLLTRSNELKEAVISEEARKIIGKDLVLFPLFLSGGSV